MVNLRPATAADVERVCTFLALHMKRGMTAEEYRPIFTYPWLPHKPDLGFMLEDDGELVGFFGTIYARREVDGHTENICNHTNWCVLEPYRSSALRLLFAASRLPNVTYTNLSSIAAVEQVIRKLGFRLLDTYKWFTVPFAHALTLAQLCRPKIITDECAVEQRLHPEHRVLFRDHQAIGCRHVLLLNADGYCYVISKRRRKKRVSFTELLYVSDPELLRRHFELVKLTILWRDRTLLLACDERIMEKPPLPAIPYRRVSMFKSATLESRHLGDNLYSEIALL